MNVVDAIAIVLSAAAKIAYGNPAVPDDLVIAIGNALRLANNYTERTSSK